jgi:hypothetical protein
MNADSSTPIPNRCQHRSHTGRQCRSTASSGSPLCARHSAAQSTYTIDFSADLINPEHHFQEAQQINHSLISLYKLVAAGRISPRRASVLAYIANLMLHSLKAIDYDRRWFKKRLAGLPITPGIPDHILEGPTLHAQSVGPRHTAAPRHR